MNIIDRINLFETSEPRTCLWCRYGILLFGGIQDGNIVACFKHAKNESRKPKVMKPLPPNTSARTWVPVFNADETRDCFVPTKLNDNKMTFLRGMGLLDEMGEE